MPLDMIVYSYIEERYCTKCKQNVGVKCYHNDDGTKKVECLNKTCEKLNLPYKCDLK